MGGLGCPAAQYLTAAGVGHITLADFDSVQVSNLHRQILFTLDDLGKAKAECAQRRLSALNPHIRIEARTTQLTADNVFSFTREHDVVIDASDNFDTRYLLNHACVRERRPLVSAAIHGFRGQLAVFNLPGGACYRCLFPEPPLQAMTCAESGVLGALPGILGAQQAMEAIKVLIGHANSEFLLYDAWQGQFQRLQLRRDPACPECGTRRSPRKPTLERALAAETLARWLSENRALAVFDVRSADERDAGMIETATALPLADLLSGAARLPQREQMIVVYCQSGLRSRQAAGHLQEQGFEHVYHLAGGFEAWKNGPH